MTSKKSVQKLARRTPVPFGKQRLYFNDDDELVDEAAAIADPDSHYMVEVPIDEAIHEKKIEEVVTKKVLRKELDRC